MIRKLNARGALYAAVISALVPLPSAFGQTAETNPSATDKKPTGTEVTKVDDEEVYVMSPFTVEATEDKDSYRAKSTLAGTRIRTNLDDLAAPISVVTQQVLKDTSSKNAQDLLPYTMSNEIGGIRGNYSGAGGSVTYNESANLLRPNNNTRTRGLAAADNTREYFLSDIPWDGYNIGRVDLSRGPNSILFGAGSPAGIINTSLNTAAFKNSNKIETKVDQFGSIRNAVDFNYVVLPKELSFRVSGVDDQSKFEQRPAFSNDRRLFLSMRYDPKLLEDGHTSIIASVEKGKIMANRPRSLAPIDGITPFFWGGKDPYGYDYIGKRTFDPNTTWNQYGNNPAYPSNTYPWFRESFMGRLMSSDIANYYNGYSVEGSTYPLFSRMGTQGTGNGIDANGNIDGNILGIEFARPYAISTFNAYARGAIPGGKYYSNVSLKDPAIFDFYHKLIDGDNKREWQNWKAVNLDMSQTFFNDRIGINYAYYGQRYDDGQYAFLGGDQYIIGIDINSKLLDGTDNPNVGRAYVGNSGQYGNNKYFIDRDSHRFTAYGEVRFEDFMEKSWLTRILGRHRFTALYSEDRKRTDNRGFSRWASDPAYAEASGNQNYEDITGGARQIDWIAYISGDLRGRGDARANLSNVTTIINPVGYQSVKYYDSHWNAPSTILPSAPYQYYTHDTNGNLSPTPTNSTQSENPANYVGWRTQSFRILNADNPDDLKSLWSSGTKTRNIDYAKGFTWQAFLWDGNLVPMIGWRKDTITSANATAPKGQYNVSLVDSYTADFGNHFRSTDVSARSWGVVLHMPKSISDKLPGKTRFSVYYNRDENSKVDAPRGDIFGNQIPNPTGKTKDFGVVISTLDDRISIKINRYETKNKDETLQADSAGFSSSLYYVWALPYWEATHALAALDGIASPQRRQGGWGWPWNGIATNADGTPNTTRIRQIVTDFFTNFPFDQHFADEYGIGLNVAKMHSSSEADWYLSVPQYGSGSIADGGNGASSLGLQPAYSGNLRSFGAGPVASVDTTSKGTEIEIIGRPLNNWNISFNAAKTDAKRTAISPTIDTWIQTYTKFLNGDAGLIRLWGGDTFRTSWANNILAPYATLKAQIGQQAPEIPKWRYNLLTTYNIDYSFLKGSYIGGAYRWEDKRILGYQYDAKTDSLDVNRPWYGPTDSHLDIWIGYSRKISKKLDWNIQLNIRNAMEHTKLVPVTINPDGNVALSRIQEGQSWQVTNTFSF